MEAVLKAAGVDDRTISYVPEVIETCRACRAWAPVKDKPQSTVDLTIKQNDKVEGDILFYKQWMIWHMLDKADRWHAGCETPGKHDHKLIEAVSINNMAANLWPL